MSLRCSDPIDILVIHATVHRVQTDTLDQWSKDVVKFGQELGQELEGFPEDE